jgi:hypothetical protein
MPGESCIVHVRFIPQGAGPKAAPLALFGDGEGSTMVMLGGEGVAPAVTLAPSDYDFGGQRVGSKSVAHAFAIRNEGGTPLEFERLRVGSESGAFTATLTGFGTDVGVADSPATDPGPQSRSLPARKGRQRRFVRGETLAAGRSQRPPRTHRAQLRASTVPR